MNKKNNKKEKVKKEMNKKEPKILLIIPAYNEEENILKVCRDLEILKENNINHIDLIFNLGIGGAMQTGYKYAYQNGYDVAIQLDGDRTT